MENKPHKSENLQPIGGGFPNIFDVVFIFTLIFILSKSISNFFSISYLFPLNQTSCKFLRRFNDTLSPYGLKIMLFIILGFSIFTAFTGFLIIIRELLKKLFKNFYRRKKILKFYIIDGSKSKYKEPQTREKLNNNGKTKDKVPLEEHRLKIYEFILEEEKFDKFSNNCEYSERLVFRFFGLDFWESKPLEQFLKDNYKGFIYFLTITDPFLFVLSFREVFYFILIGLPVISNFSYTRFNLCSPNSHFQFPFAILEIVLAVYFLVKIFIIENNIRSLFYFFDYIYSFISTKGFDTFFDKEILEFIYRYREKIKRGKFLLYEIIELALKS